MKMAQQRELMIMRAKEYAQSGDYADSMLIEIALRGEFPKARQWLSRFAKQELDEMCRQAQEK
jgi:hypothetical protein